MQRFTLLFINKSANLLIRDRAARDREVTLAPKCFPANCFRNRGNSCSSTGELVPFSRCTTWLTRCVGR